MTKLLHSSRLWTVWDIKKRITGHHWWILHNILWKREGLTFLANHFCTLFVTLSRFHFKTYLPFFSNANVKIIKDIYIPSWAEFLCIWWRWSLLKVVPFGYQNHHQFQEAFHGEQLHPALLHGQYPLVQWFSRALLFYHFHSLLVGLKIVCCLNMMYTRFNSKE